MSIFKKSVTSVVLLALLWQSVGIAMAATIRYSSEKPAPATQMNNPLSAILNPTGNMAGMAMVQGLDDEGGINIPLSANGNIQDLDLMRTMLTEMAEMAASAPVEMSPEGNKLQTPTLQQEMTGGDARVRSNDAGAIIIDLNANTQSDKVFDMTESTPMLWARYYPARKVGYIQMITLRKKPYTPLSGDVAVGIKSQDPQTRANAIGNLMEIQTEVLGPADGARLVKGNGSRLPYRGVNPFSAFLGSDPKLYSQISFSAFLTAVGVWGRYYSTQRGFVAVAENRQEKRDWNECIKNSIFGCLKRRNNVESYVEVRPRWYLMTSVENGVGKANVLAYASNECISRQSSFPLGPQFESARETECVVFSGAAFLEATSNTDIPNEWIKVWHQHDAKEGNTWNFFFLILLPFVGVLGGAILAQFFVKSLDISVNSVGVTNGLLVAGAYAFTTMLMQGSANRSSLPPGFFGGLLPGIETPNLAGEGDPKWSPHECIVNGPAARVPYLYSGAPAKSRFAGTPLPLSGCIQWLRNDLKDAPGSVGDYYRIQQPDAVRDYVTPNDVERMSNPATRPRRFDGAPVRE